MSGPSFKLRLQKTSEQYDLDPPVAVERVMGNGLRRVLARTVSVATRPGRPGAYVTLTGPTLKRDGTKGREASVYWLIGRGDRDPAPQVVLDILAEAER